MSAPLPVVLVVDDNPLDRRLACAILDKSGRARSAAASDGRDALDAIEGRAPALVLTDLQMPEMSGLELVDAIKRHHPDLPVILMTAHGSEDVAFEALRRGAAGYVPKQALQGDLMATVERTLQAARGERRPQLLDCFRELDCTLELENDPALVPQVVAFFQEHLGRMGVCDGNRKVRVGVALEEAMLNAIYHGNLELSSDLRQDGGDTFQKMAASRRGQQPYAPRRVRVSARIAGGEGRFVVRDEGPGFDVANLPDPTDPENLCKLSGRGVLLIRLFMDATSYNEKGNELTMTVRARAAQ